MSRLPKTLELDRIGIGRLPEPEPTKVWLRKLADTLEDNHKLQKDNIDTLEDVPWFDLKNYGAAGNGVADDTKPMQAAITDAKAVKGKVRVPLGTFMTTGLTADTFLYMEGASMYGSIIQLLGSDTDDILLQIEDEGAAWNDGGPATLRHLTLKGNWTTGDPGNYGDVVYANYAGNLVFEDVLIRDATGNNLHVRGAGYVVVRESVLYAAYRDGFFGEGLGSATGITYAQIKNSQIFGNSRYGVHLKNYAKVIDIGPLAVIYSNPTGMYIEGTGHKNLHIYHSHFESNANKDIDFGSSDGIYAYIGYNHINEKDIDWGTSTWTKRDIVGNQRSAGNDHILADLGRDNNGRLILRDTDKAGARSTGLSLFGYTGGAQKEVGSLVAQVNTGALTLGYPASTFSKLAFATNGVERAHIDNTGNFIPGADDSYYLGQLASPYKAFKGIILKDTTNGKHYKAESINGTLTLTALD